MRWLSHYTGWKSTLMILHVKLQKKLESEHGSVFPFFVPTPNLGWLITIFSFFNWQFWLRRPSVKEEWTLLVRKLWWEKTQADLFWYIFSFLFSLSKMSHLSSFDIISKAESETEGFLLSLHFCPSKQRELKIQTKPISVLSIENWKYK